MYAIFETGGKQYKVAAGDVLRIEKVAGAAGDSIQFSNVIAFSAEGGSLKTGTPFLDATVNATILGEGKGKKVIIFKFKAKKDYRKKNGHRQPFTEIEIENFTVDGVTVGVKPEKPVEAPKPEVVKEEKAAKDEKAPEAEAEETAELEPVAEDEVKPEVAEVTTEAEDAEEAPVEEVVADEAEAEEAPVEEVVADEVPAEEAAAEAVTDEASAETAVPAAKLTKADIMAKLDELGADYAKSAKKDELLAILAEAESK
jgi:large subunit ribosomal protein L21